MKILLEQGGHAFLNMGDLAMLQVAINRLSGLESNSSIQVCTSAPDRLNYYCPTTQPLLPQSQVWFSPFLSHVHKLPSKSAVQLWSQLEDKCRRRAPGLVRSFIKFKLQRYPKKEYVEQFEAYMEAVHQADLVIATGGGYITDVFKGHAKNVLDTLDLAMSLGKPAAILGQGLGPLRDSELQAKAKAVLPKLKLISLREKRSGVPLLESLDISADRFIVTGDDAIELAYEARNPTPGTGIGVNLRVAHYAQINPAVIEAVRSALQFTAKLLAVPLMPVPISRQSRGKELSDSMAICKLLEGYDVSDGGIDLDTPLKVIEQIGRCSVVVTGSYHAGVFALSQGIPVIGLAKSEYYADKFLGLADQFGAGCEVMFLNDPDLKENLSRQILNLWEKSEFLRPQLLAAADRQIHLSRAAYRKVFELVA